MSRNDEPEINGFEKELANPVLSPDGVAITALRVITDSNENDAPIFRVSASDKLTPYRWILAAQHLKEHSEVAEVMNMTTRGISVKASPGVEAEDFAIMLLQWRVDWTLTVRKPIGPNDFMRNQQQRVEAAEIREESRRPTSQRVRAKLKF